MHSRHLLKTGLIAGITTASLLVPMAGGAMARPGGGHTPHAAAKGKGTEAARREAARKERAKREAEKVARVQRECARHINRIDRGFTELLAAIDASENLTPDHKAALTDEVTADQAALAEAKAALDTATTIDAARAACRTALGSVEALRFDARKARVVSRADRIDMRISDAMGLLGDLSAAIDTYEADGNDVTELRAALAELQSALDGIAAEAGDRGDEFLAIEPGEGARALLETAGKTLGSAREALGGIEEAAAALADSLQPVDPPAGGGDVIFT